MPKDEALKQEPNEPQQFTISLTRVLVNPAAPKPVSRFLYTQVGGNVQLDIGYYDLVEFKEAMEKSVATGEPAQLHITITDRFVLTPENAIQWLEAAQQLVEALRKGGHLPLSQGTTNDGTTH